MHHAPGGASLPDKLLYGLSALIYNAFVTVVSERKMLLLKGCFVPCNLYMFRLAPVNIKKWFQVFIVECNIVEIYGCTIVDLNGRLLLRNFQRYVFKVDITTLCDLNAFIRLKYSVGNVDIFNAHFR